jgi:1-acyl-sn-glycerol-3-phosphate acyltransferase
MRQVLLGLYAYLVFLLLALVLLPAFVAVALWKRRRDPTNRARGRMMRFFGRAASILTPMWRFTVEGQAPADIEQRGYVVVSNHESNADPFLLSHLPFAMRFIAKEELFRLPLLGWLMRCGGDVRLKRGDATSVRAMMAECERTLRGGLPVMIFPEGTRSRDGQLLPFKDGAFRLAIQAGAPILPLVIEGTRTCMPKGSRWFGVARASVRILDPIATDGMTDVAALRDLTRECIARARTSSAGARESVVPSALPAGAPPIPLQR